MALHFDWIIEHTRDLTKWLFTFNAYRNPKTVNGPQGYLTIQKKQFKRCYQEFMVYFLHLYYLHGLPVKILTDLTF